MSTTLDGSVAILWGSATRELNWVHLSPKHGRTSVARAHAGGFWVREIHEVPPIEAIADEAYEAWTQIRRGEDLSDWATHMLIPPAMQDIEPVDPVSHE
jgi:hypothetical protein